MNTDKTSSLSLRIFSKSLSCIDISNALDWQPSEKFEKGELWGGRTNKRPREESLWIYNLDLDEKILITEQLKSLIDKMLDKKDNFQKIKDECQMDISCSYTTYNGQGGFTLEADLMRTFSSLNMDLSIDFYALDEIFEKSVVKPQD